VFAALRGAVDEKRSENGRFVVLGSAQPGLVRGVAESLAGRVRLVELDPLTAAEVLRQIAYAIRVSCTTC